MASSHIVVDCQLHGRAPSCPIHPPVSPHFPVQPPGSGLTTLPREAPRLRSHHTSPCSPQAPLALVLGS